MTMISAKTKGFVMANATASFTVIHNFSEFQALQRKLTAI